MVAAAAAALALAPRPAPAASVSLTADTASIHAGMAFTLTLTATGFEEEPAPAASELAIEGCRVTYLGVDPAVSTRITIVNGRTTEERDVTFRYRWRVLAPASGTYRVPPLEVAQGSLAARTPASTFEATAVPETPDMLVRMRLPADGVYEGAAFDVAVDWLIARDAESFEVEVPLFALEGAVVAAAPGAGGGERFASGPAIRRSISRWCGPRRRFGDGRTPACGFRPG